MPNIYSVAILAGGLAARLRPITKTIPKALIKINNEPFISHQLRLLKTNGIKHVVMCVSYLGEMIQSFVGDGKKYGLTVDYAFDGHKLLGTAGALKQALPLLTDNFFVLYGDSYLPCDYQAVQKAFEQSKKLALMTVFHNQGKLDTSNVEFMDNCIKAYDKQHRTRNMQYIDYGLGIFNKKAFTNIPKEESYDLASLYQDLLQQQLAAYEVSERFYEIGSLNGIKDLEDYIKNNRRKK